MRVGVYCRVSTDDQAERGTIETQRDFARRYCEEHRHEIHAWYIDDGVSSGVPLPDRPEGGRLVRDAEAGCFEAVLVYRQDRLCREVADLVISGKRLQAAGVLVQSMTESDDDTPEGEAMRVMRGVFAQLEKANILRRARDGSLRVARADRHCGGAAPFGYRVGQNGLLEVYEPEAEVVRYLFRLYLGGSGTSEIAYRLTRERVLPPRQSRESERNPEFASRYSGEWTAATVRRIIRHRVYMGEPAYGKQSVVRKNGKRVGLKAQPREKQIVQKGPAIIEPDDFERAQRSLALNYNRARGTDYPYLLRRLIRCAVCGRWYNGGGAPKGKWHYYKCSSIDHRAHDGRKHLRCGNIGIQAERLEQDIWARIVEFARNPGAIMNEIAAKNRSKLKEAEAIKAKLLAKDEEICRQQSTVGRIVETTIDMRALGQITEEEASRKIGAVRTRLVELKGERERLAAEYESLERLQDRLGDVETTLAELRSRAENPTLEAKRAVFLDFVDRIEVTPVREPGRKPEAHVSISFIFKRNRAVAGSGSLETYPSAYDSLPTVTREVYGRRAA